MTDNAELTSIVGSVDDRAAFGKTLRKTASRSSHGEWSPEIDRPDPVKLLEEQNASRVPWLVPIRHRRMQVSPFTFYRGTARIMATDLSTTPSSGLTVQLAGDAHLSNFGAYASPERRLVFDQNDFDETLPGPWEWDLKRLSASVMIAGQHLGFRKAECRRATSEATRAYREAMAGFAHMGFLELWYDYIDAHDVSRASDLHPEKVDLRVKRFKKRATRKTSLQALKKLAVVEDGRYRVRSNPPVLFSLRDLPNEQDPAMLESAAAAAFEAYKETLADDCRVLLDRYELCDVGMKVVGVGSVGTLAMLLLLRGRDDGDPLLLQAKEADASVLEEHLGQSEYDNHGRRVVEGQRLVQAQTDIFLGWTAGLGPQRRHFYVRQLRDWKGSVEIEGGTPKRLRFYAGLCGLTLARGHARSGDAAAIQAYAGRGANLDRAMTAFAESYAKQNREDFERFQQAITDGRLEVAASG
jgi:uncharacterized protein (DUF2252 family)